MARPSTAQPPSNARHERAALPGVLSWIPELVAIVGLVAVVALLVSAIA